MLDKFFVWFGNNRKTIGYSIGGLNVLGGLNHALHGDYGLALLWFIIGGFLILDSYEFK
jgi:hypothetical protein